MSAPDETLLDYLRLRRSLRGSKEGCAEGDCGACTVLVGRLSAGKLIYEGVNACIRFVGSLDGCHVVTVEHLRGREGGLHPVQQAMVDFHGSQCGFCTPGFVMSLYALWMTIADAVGRRRSKRRCRAISAAAPATRRSCGRRMAISSYGKAAKDPLAAERKAIIGAGLRRCATAAASRSATGKQRLLVPAIARRSRRRCLRPSRQPRSSRARPMSGCG